MIKTAISPDELKKASERYEDYHQTIQNVINSIESDKDWIFPPFSGSNPMEESFEELLANLQRCNNIILSFSEMMQKTSTAIEIPDEPLTRSFIK